MKGRGLTAGWTPIRARTVQLRVRFPCLRLEGRARTVPQGAAARGSVAATAAPTKASAAVDTQKASQPASSATRASSGVESAERRKTTVAATATERAASSGRARSPDLGRTGHGVPDRAPAVRG